MAQDGVTGDYKQTSTSEGKMTNFIVTKQKFLTSVI